MFASPGNSAIQAALHGGGGVPAPGAPLLHHEPVPSPVVGTPATAHHGFIASILASLLAGPHHGINPPVPFAGGQGGLLDQIHPIVGGSPGVPAPAPAPSPAGPVRVDPGAGGFDHQELGPGAIVAPVPTPPPGVAPPPAGSYNPAQYYRATGNPVYAAQLWESHHPGAMAGNAPIPSWVTQALISAIQSHMTPSGQGSGPNPVTLS